MFLHSRSALYVIFLLLAGLPLFAQNTIPSPFGVPRIISEGKSFCSQLASADMDGDGHADVVAVDAGLVTWFKADTLGQVLAKHVVHSDKVMQGRSPLLADWDNDQDIDVLYPHYDSGFFYWFANDGSGEFGPAQPLFPVKTSDWGFPILLADINQDGFPDVFTKETGADSIQVQWYENDGAGFIDAIHHITHGNLSITNYVNTPSIFDIEGDGDPDVFVINQHQQLFSLLNDGAGHFSAPVLMAENSQFYPWNELAMADFDNDGDPDLYSVALQNGFLYFPNDGSGGFGPSVACSPDASTGQPPMVVADFSGDGLPDVLRLGNNGPMILLINNGAGNIFTKKTYSLTKYSVSGGGTDLKAVDVDADGRLDIVVITNYVLAWLRNEGNGDFAPVDNFYPAITPALITSGDLDGDGLQDYIAGDAHVGNLVWYQNKGNQTFGPKQVVGLLNGVRQIIPTDLDQDGDTDLLTREYTGEIIRSFLNDGSGKFQAGQSFADGGNISNYKAYAVDLNGDKTPEIATIHHIYWNNGAGQFDSIMPFETTFPILPADLDGDGDMDILASFGNAWAENDGHGGLTAKNTNIPPGTHLDFSQVALQDFDGDSIPELITNFRINDWYGLARIGHLVQGDTLAIQFIGTSLSSVPLPHQEFFPADMDADGDQDLFTTWGLGTWLLLWNNGTGFFPEVSFMPLDSLNLVEPADFDNDGVPDLQFAEAGGNSMGWMRSYLQDFYIRGTCFEDVNENGTRDAGEASLQNIGVVLVNSGQVAYSDQDGAFKFYVDPSITHDLQFTPNLCWSFSSDSALLSLAPTLGGFPNLELGFKKIADTTAVRFDITGSQARCDSKAPFWISLQNIACNETSGRFCLIVDSLAVFQSASPMPDLISPNAAGHDTLWWHFDALQPTKTHLFRLVLLIADASHTGDSVRIHGFSFLQNDQQSFELKDSIRYAAEIRCSFDPNDKQVDRTRLPLGYAPSSNPLLYTIRFQNTGNDTAQVVRIRDTLDFSLNPNTFRPLGSSHPYRCESNYSGRALEFVFENIALPDSNTNALASQGFVTFVIEPYSGLIAGSIIPNQAHIFFDKNAAVSTNRVETEVALPLSVSPLATPDWPISVVPNPNNGDFAVELPETTIPRDCIVQILDMTGRLLSEKQVEPGNNRPLVQANHLPSGLYFVQVRSAGRLLGTEKFVKL